MPLARFSGGACLFTVLAPCVPHSSAPRALPTRAFLEASADRVGNGRCDAAYARDCIADCREVTLRRSVPRVGMGISAGESGAGREGPNGLEGLPCTRQQGLGAGGVPGSKISRTGPCRGEVVISGRRSAAHAGLLEPASPRVEQRVGVGKVADHRVQEPGSLEGEGLKEWVPSTRSVPWAPEARKDGDQARALGSKDKALPTPPPEGVLLPEPIRQGPVLALGTPSQSPSHSKEPGSCTR